MRYVYDFTEGNKDQKDLLGGKGANLAEMTRLGLPVPPGFTITTEACRYYLRDGIEPPGLRDEMHSHLGDLEHTMGKKLGDAQDPLLVSCRSGAKFSKCLRVRVAMVSAPRRDLMKTMVRTWSAIRSVRIDALSAMAVRRSGAPFSPVRSDRGGSQSPITSSPEAEKSRVRSASRASASTSASLTPTVFSSSKSAIISGLPIVGSSRQRRSGRPAAAKRLAV